MMTLNKIKRPSWAFFKGNWAKIWDNYILNLNMALIRLSLVENNLVWIWNKVNGKITTKEAYHAIVLHLHHSRCSFNGGMAKSRSGIFP